MPDVPDDDYRVVLGEESLDWRGLTATELGKALDTLSDLLQPLTDGRTVAIMQTAYETECLPSAVLAEALYSRDGGLPQEERRRLQSLLDKCRKIEPEDEDIPPLVRLADGHPQEASWGLAHALARAATGRAMSCLLLPAMKATGSSRPTGWITVHRDTGADRDEVELHLLRTTEDAVAFWRGMITREKVSEEQFFALTPTAFPDLLFAPSLRFNRFRGSHGEVLNWLVGLLGLLNDHFSRTLADCGGDQKKVQDYFKAMGADISPESPNTKKNAKAWAERLVEYDGDQHRCEWHGKRRWDCDRVHFSLPLKAHSNRVLIGIFVDHLPT
ncbi:hypothetical protein [Streptomyces sp. NPDC050804]|uniref:hypothetical protein n=1 Tax=Streptomyces sp. NPDC050804 TaxID=3154745 RepID=UPI00342C734A